MNLRDHPVSNLTADVSDTRILILKMMLYQGPCSADWHRALKQDITVTAYSSSTV